jgi:hypothetical protein
LKGLFPEKYRDNQAGISFNGPSQINIVIKDESASLPSTTQDLITCAVKKMNRINHLKTAVPECANQRA